MTAKTIERQFRGNKTMSPCGQSPRPAICRALRALLGFPAAVLLLGCATIGHPFPPDRVQGIRVAETSKAQLLGIFGLPYRRGIDDGDSTWTYLHYKVRLFGEHLRTRDLYVRFDTQGLVKSFSYNSNMED